MPVIVLAPADVKDCYTLTRHAFNLAEQHRCPVFIASNKEIAMTRASVHLESLPAPEVIDRTAPPPGQPFHPFQAGGSNAGLLPIGGRTACQTHRPWPDGYITTDPAEITACWHACKPR
jgi:2-oxoglutarate ferredoxin oxidoreductase subunit alpha